MLRGEVSYRRVLKAWKYADTDRKPSRARKSGLVAVTGGDEGGETPRSDGRLPDVSCRRLGASCSHRGHLCFSRPPDFLRAPTAGGAPPSAWRRSATSSSFDIVVEGFVTLISRPLFLSTQAKCHETNLSTQGAPAEAPPRLPSPHADPFGSRRIGVPTPQGTQAPRRLNPPRFGARATSAGSLPAADASNEGHSPWLRSPVSSARPGSDWSSGGESVTPSSETGPSADYGMHSHRSHWSKVWTTS